MCACHVGHRQSSHYYHFSIKRARDQNQQAISQQRRQLKSPAEFSWDGNPAKAMQTDLFLAKGGGSRTISMPTTKNGIDLIQEGKAYLDG